MSDICQHPQKGPQGKSCNWIPHLRLRKRISRTPVLLWDQTEGGSPGWGTLQGCFPGLIVKRLIQALKLNCWLTVGNK